MTKIFALAFNGLIKNQNIKQRPVTYSINCNVMNINYVSNFHGNSIHFK